MIQQFSKFFLNGVLLGIVSWGLQALIYRGLGGNSGLAYGFATALTYIPLVAVNFLVQRKWVFRRGGLFWRFVSANLLIMASVTIASPAFRTLISWFAGVEWGNIGGFPMAALVMSIPSFLIKRRFVFRPEPDRPERIGFALDDTKDL